MTTTSTPPTGQVQWCHGLGCFATLPEIKPGWVQAAGWWWCPEHSEDGRRMAAAGCDVCPMADGTHAGQCERAASDARQRPPPTPPASLPLSPWTGPLTPGQVDYARKLAEHTLKTEGGPGLGTAERYLVARWAVETAAHLQAAADVLDCGVYEVAAAARGLLTLSWALVEKGVRKVEVRQSVAESLWEERLRLRGELADTRQHGHEVTQALLALTHPHTGHLMHEEGACTGECREVRRVLKQEGVEDIPVGVVVPATLSSVPGDVARDHDAVESDLRTEGYTDTSNAMQALSRLATAAARVPGLEARVEDLTSQVKHAEEKRGEAEDLLEATERETRKVEAERDEQRARADHAESERNAAQRDLVGVINERDAARQKMDVWCRNAHAAEAARDTLTARVAELERLAYIGEHHFPDLTWKARCGEAEARATAAEAKAAEMQRIAETLKNEVLKESDNAARAEALATVAEQAKSQPIGLTEEARAIRLDYEAARDALRQHPARVCRAGSLAIGRLRDRALAAARSQPTPAPGLREPAPRDVLAMMQPMRPDLEDMNAPYVTGYTDGIRDDRARRSASPPLAVAPGLREAAGSVFATLKDMGQMGALLAADAEAMAVVGGIPTEQWRNLMDWLERRFLSTAPEPVVTHAQLAAVVEEMKAAPGEDCCAVVLGEVLRRVTGGEVPEVAAWKEKAAKWDAAVAREATLVEQGRVLLTRETDLVRYVVHGDGTPVPEVLPKARLVEVLARLHSESSPSEYGAGWSACVAAVRSMLGLTLPTGPREGATKTDPVDAYWLGQKTAERMATHRARIAQTPTSEGPALVWCEDNDHHWDTKDGDLPSDGRQEAKCTRCPAAATRARLDVKLYRIPSKPAQAEPAAPEVEWQWRDESGNSANVTTHGHLHSHGDIWEVAHALARSLVEEKRRLKLVQEAHAGAYLVLDRVEAEERGRWKPVLDALGEALGVAPPTTAPSINRDAALALEVVRGRAASRLLHWLGAPVDGVLGVEGRRVRDFAEGTPIPDAVRGVLEEESRQTERLLAQLQSLVGSISKAAEVEDWGRALLVALAASLPGRHAWGQEVLVEWKSLDAPVRGALRLAAASLLRKAKQGGVSRG